MTAQECIRQARVMPARGGPGIQARTARERQARVMPAKAGIQAQGRFENLRFLPRAGFPPARERHWRLLRTPTGVLSLCVALILAGCVVQSEVPVQPTTPGRLLPREKQARKSRAPAAPPRSPSTPTGPADSANNASERPFDPSDNPSGQSVSMMMRAAFMPLGIVPHDGFALPLISPDGQFVATQTGSAPEWNVTLAQPGAAPPHETMIEVYRLDTREAIKPEERLPPERIAQVSEAAVLGRSCDVEGFLIEAPQEDGSRWIGKAAWESGEIRWLVQGRAVNAFAAEAPDGRLAWCRRAPDSERFDLILRDADGSEWMLRSDGGDWLTPVWASFGEGLYAMHRQDGRLRICFGVGGNEQEFRTSLREFVLAASSDDIAAYQAFSAQTATDGCRASTEPCIMLFHPTAARMIMWRPLSIKNRAAIQLNARSLAALQHTADAAIVSLGDETLLQSLRQGDAHTMLARGTWLPRRTPNWDWPYVLLSPQPDQQQILITALRLLPTEPR
jgi:hypothetical protein